MTSSVENVDPELASRKSQTNLIGDLWKSDILTSKDTLELVKLKSFMNVKILKRF